MTIYNRGYCFNCADPTEDYADLTPNYRVYVCPKKECHKALRAERQEQEEAERG